MFESGCQRFLRKLAVTGTRGMQKWTDMTCATRNTCEAGICTFSLDSKGCLP